MGSKKDYLASEGLEPPTSRIPGERLNQLGHEAVSSSSEPNTFTETHILVRSVRVYT